MLPIWCFRFRFHTVNLATGMDVKTSASAKNGWQQGCHKETISYTFQIYRILMTKITDTHKTDEHLFIIIF